MTDPKTIAEMKELLKEGHIWVEQEAYDWPTTCSHFIEWAITELEAKDRRILELIVELRRIYNYGNYPEELNS